MNSTDPENTSSGITVTEIHKSYGNQKVLNGLSLKLNPGELTLLLGQNGSGKSTLLRICAGLSRPDVGSILTNSPTPRVLAPREVGYIGHQTLLYAALTLRENLRLTQSLLKAGKDINAYLSQWQLSAHADKRISELSKGLQFRAGLARALLHSPPFIFLDEPSAALDDVAMNLFLDELKAATGRDSSRATICVATHDIARFAAAADRAIVLSQGVITRDSQSLHGSTVADTIQYYREINR